MSISTAKIVALTTAENPPEVRGSALIVLGELGVRESAVTAAVLEALGDANDRVRGAAVRSAGKLKVEKALPQLIERIRHGGTEAESAAESAVRLGSKGLQALHELMGHVVPGVRKYIATALASADAEGAKDGIGLEMLADRDPQVVEATVQTLAGRLPGLDAKRRRQLADELFAVAKNKKLPLTAAGEAGLVRLAAIMDDPRVPGLLWDRIDAGRPPEARAAALQALGNLIEAPSKDQRAKLFECATAADFRVAAPAMMILDRASVTEKSAAEWLGLFEADDPAVRRFALGKVGSIDGKEIAKALMTQIRHPDRKYRDDVLARLAAMENGRTALADPLKAAETAEEAWSLARVVAPFAHGDSATWSGLLFAKTCAYVESGDRRADALLFVLKEAGAADLRDRLEAKGDAYRKKSDHEKALLYYKTAARDPAVGRSIRIGLAVSGLIQSPKDLGADSRARDSALQQVADLIRQDGPALIDVFAKEKSLGADELYYLGFNFIDHSGIMGDFGADVLRLLIKRFPKNKSAVSAKNKIKSSGFTL